MPIRFAQGASRGTHDLLLGNRKSELSTVSMISMSCSCCCTRHDGREAPCRKFLFRKGTNHILFLVEATDDLRILRTALESATADLSSRHHRKIVESLGALLYNQYAAFVLRGLKPSILFQVSLPFWFPKIKFS